MPSFNTDVQEQKGIANSQVQAGLNENQYMVSNTYQGVTNLTPVNGVGVQSVNNGNFSGSSSVVTSDGAQPFDISSMFLNNK
jgi:hypothetical protein